MIKLIASDLDGTLLNDRKQISPESLRFIRLLEEKHIGFALVSGRSREAILNVIGDIPCSMVTDNGSRAYRKDGTCLFWEKIDIQETLDVIEKIEKTEYMHVFLVGEKYIYTKQDSAERKIAGYYFSPELVKVHDWEEAFRRDDISKMSINTGWDGRNEERGLRLIRKEMFDRHFSLVLSGDGWIEFMKEGVSKGNALKSLCQSMDISMEETMVFGDYMNDLSMLSLTPNSYAMKNGHEEVKRQCNYVTSYDNNEDGVIRAIDERLGLSKFSRVCQNSPGGGASLALSTDL